MSNISNLAPTKIFRGQFTRAFLNPTINAGGDVTITAGAPSAGGGLLDNVAHPNAKDLGYLAEDGVQFETAPTYEDLPVLNSNEPILFGLVKRVTSIKLKGLQIRDYAVWAKIKPALAVRTGTNLTGIGDQIDQTVTPFSLAVIAPTHNDPTKYHVLVAYSGYDTAPFNVLFAKKWNVTDINMTLLDPGRADGFTWSLWETQ